MAEIGNRKSILIIAGEVSGDMHAAKVVRAIQQQDPSVTFWGVGGDELRTCGVEILHDVKEMAVMGLSEVLQKYGFFKRVFDEMLGLARERRPSAVILVDYPGFNLRFAEQAHAAGLKVIYYICPQVWAWHRSRIRKMARIVDRLLVIFPFEVDVFKDTGLRVDFVGHPLVEEARLAQEAPEKSLPWESELRVALLPGSRRQEVRRILPPMLAAASQLEREMLNISFIIAAPSQEIAQCVDEVASAQKIAPARIATIVGETREVLRQARAAMVASGTATIEASLMGCPMVVVYKTAWLTYTLGRLLVQVPHIGMVNIVAGESLCPEFIQGGATPGALVAGLTPLLEDTPEYHRAKTGLERVALQLGGEQNVRLAADIVLSELV